MKGTAQKMPVLHFVLLFSIACSASSTVFAQNLESEMLRIQTLVEAGDTDRALRHYESLLQDRMEGWQQAVIQYNIGTVLLMEGKIDEALAQYRSISINNLDNPLLKQRLDANIALAKLMLVEATLKKLKSNSDPTSSDYSLAIAALRDSLVAISLAEKSACSLSVAEGSQVCQPLLEIDEMHFEAKRLLGDLLESYFKYKLEHVSLQEASVSLLIGIDAMMDNLSFLQQQPNEQPYKAQYASLFLMQAQGWNPMWDGLENAIKKLPAGASSHEDFINTFNRAKKDYSEAIRLLEKGDFSSSQAAFKHSKMGVENLISRSFGYVELKDSLHQLLVLYELVLAKEPLQERGLEALAKTQKQLQPLVEAQGSSELKSLFTVAAQDLETSRKAIEALQLLQGRMFMLAAQDAVKTMSLKVSRKKETPISILEQALYAESLALQVNLLKQTSEGREPLLEISHSLLQRLQKQVFPEIEKFFGASIEQQIIEFRSIPPIKGADLRCQISPWEAAIPLVVQGQQYAEKAKAALAVGQINEAADWQAKAIKKWQEALAQLKAPKKPREKEKQQDNKEKKEEKKQQEVGSSKERLPASGGGTAEQNGAGRTDLNSVLRLLQEMEKDDRSKPKKNPINEGQGKDPGNRVEQRPW